MTNRTEQFARRPRQHAAIRTAAPVAATAEDRASSPQDFSRELAAHEDGTRRSQVKDEQP